MDTATTNTEAKGSTADPPCHGIVTQISPTDVPTDEKGLGDPSLCPSDALIAECEKLKLETTGTRADLIQRITTCIGSEDAPEEWTPKMLMRKNKDELQEECVTRGLSPQGTKRTIVERLMLDEKRQQYPGFRDTLEEMQHLVVDTGEIMKNKVERIVDLLGEPEEEPVAEKVEEDQQVDFTPTNARRMKKADLIATFSPLFPDLDFKAMRRPEILSLVLREYYKRPPASKQSEKVVTEEVRSEEAPTKAEEPAEQMARMMMMDQVKTGRGVFIGDIDASIDRLIEEMRTIYGAYLPLHLKTHIPDIFDDEDLEVAEAEEAEEDATEVEDAATKEDETMASDENGDLDEEEMMDGEDIVDNEMIDVEEAEEADWTRGPMGGPDMDENETLLERALDVDEETDATGEIEMVRGKRRSRSERVPEVAEEEREENVVDDLGVYSIDLYPPTELTETEFGTRSVEDMAREILEMHARDELLKMSEEKFYKLVEPLCLDVGPFREEFVAKIVALAGVDLEDRGGDEAPETTDLIELSLSTLDTESDEMEIRERLVDNAEYTPAPVINMAPSTLEAYKDADILEDEKPQEMGEVVPMPEALAVEEEEDVMADEKEQKISEMPFDEDLDTDAYAEEMVEPKEEMAVAQEMITEDASATGVDTEEEILVEESTTQMEEGIVEETTLSERFDVTSEAPPAEVETEEPSSLEEDREMAEAEESGEEEPPIVSEDEDAGDMRDALAAEEEIESTVPFVNGVEPVDAEPDSIALTSTEPLNESSSLPDTTTFFDDKPSEVIDDLEDVNTVSEMTPAAIEGVADSEKPAPEVAVGDAAESEVESVASKETTASDAAVKNIERVLREIQQQRIEWESSTQDITQLDVGAQLAEQQQKKESLKKDLDQVTTEFETLQQKVDVNEDKIVELRKEINSESSSTAASTKPQEKDLFKKHSSIAVGLAFGVTELCKKVFPNLFEHRDDRDDGDAKDDEDRTM